MRGEIFGERAHILLVSGDVQDFVWFVFLAVDYLGDGRGPRHLKLELLAAHRLDENRQVQFTSSGDDEHIRAGCRIDPQADVGPQFSHQPFMKIAGCAVNAVLAHERGSAHAEGHAHRGFVDVDCRQSLRVLGRSDGIADGHAVDAGNRYDVSGKGFGYLNPLHPPEHEDTLDIVRAYLAVAPQQGDIIAHTQRSVGYAANRDLAQIVVVVQGCHEHLQRSVRIAGGRRDRLHNRVEERLHVRSRYARVVGSVAVASRGVQHREVKLFHFGSQFQEQVLDHRNHFCRARLRAVYLVDDNHRRNILPEGLAKHIGRLRHGTVHRIDQQQAAVCHIHHALHFAAEVGVARRVDNVNPHVSIGD